MQKPEPRHSSTAAGWQRDCSTRFVFAGRRFDPSTGLVRLEYDLDGIELSESFRLPGAGELPAGRVAAVEAALDLLHWTAGISYWKAGCPATVDFIGTQPDAWQAAWLDRLYREGLAEFAWRNRLDQDSWARFPAAPAADPAIVAGLSDRALIPMGGGKDSLVALERMRARRQPLCTVQVGQAPRIRQVAEAAGTQHLVIERAMTPELAELNRAGAYNGHVPITAINAAALILTAVVHDFGRIVFANERSADEPTLIDDRGRAVNHQFSKSLAFETMLGDWVQRCIARDLAVFSLLRRDRELAVCREFAGLEQYHAVFSSCNRNFHLDGARTDRWCGTCPKCHFVFLALAPFLSPQRLVDIFGRNLLDDPEQAEGFRALLALDRAKPFECVGEAVEARAALAALAADPAWAGAPVVTALAPELRGLEVPPVADLCRPGRAHRIPDDLITDA